MKTKQKAITPIVATILLVVVSVILVTIVLNWGKSFSNSSLATVDTEKLVKSNASEFVYTKVFSDGIIQFNYGPPDSLTNQNIVITGYKIFSDNNETAEIVLDSNHTLSQGLNIIPLTSFSDQNITSRKMNIQLKTSDGKYITLNNIINNEPYVAPPPALQQFDTGAHSPGTVVDDANVGFYAWTNPGNAVSSNDSYAVVNPGPALVITHYLKATNFGFSIPTGATINGILVEIERKTANYTYIKDNNVQIVKADGTIGTTNKADTVNNWPISDTYKSYGSSSDLWGETWNDTKINDIDFGVVLSAYVYYDIAYVDHIRITVYYTN